LLSLSPVGFLDFYFDIGMASLNPYMDETLMTPQKKLSSLSDLGELLTGSEREQLQAGNSQRKRDGKGKTVRVSLDSKGRKGKLVTLIEGLQHNPDTMEEIARVLKQYCGAGGTVKQGTIEIQGDQRQKVAEKLREMNYAIR
jgi:translation initiation factor 1